MIIAVDGPVAAGKGTLARCLAAHLGFAYLDSGSLYRATAAKVLASGDDPGDPVAAARAAATIDAGALSNPALRDEAVGEAASRVAALPEVRTALLAYQRCFASDPPGDLAGAVIDGRDIGTVVCPAAEVKLFVTADIEARARRRYAELSARGDAVIYEDVRQDLLRRDARDALRRVSPLVPADDAHLLDTTNLDIEAAFRAALAIIAAR